MQIDIQDKCFILHTLLTPKTCKLIAGNVPGALIAAATDDHRIKILASGHGSYIEIPVSVVACTGAFATFLYRLIEAEGEVLWHRLFLPL